MFSEIEGQRGVKHKRKSEFINDIEQELPIEHTAYDKIIVQ